ncbi:MAG: 5'-methylthioadenosine/S-adenosylhomocysteine nucleosidase [Oscillibacter sp.]|nr:5'-methylthioadenosine/S-adenosylhomocysteine nucleosidase [Oscillibacter sp.]
MKIGMQFAMEAELHALPGAKELEPFETVSGVPFYQVAEDVVACAGGIGKVNAAMAAEALCLRQNVDLVVSAGVAGCLGDLPTGALVVPSEFIQHDMDTTAIGDEIGLVSTVNRLAFPTWKPERCRTILRALGVETETGRVATGDWFATAAVESPAGARHWIPADRAAWIRDTFHPLLVEMEGCAVAQVCQRNGIPFVALKSVSDHLFREGQVEEYFDFSRALENLGRVLLPFVLELRKETT